MSDELKVRGITIKSAEPLDAEAAHVRLAQAADEAESPGFRVRRQDDGRTRVDLATGLVAKAEEPPSPEEIRELAERRGITWDDEYVDRTVRYWASDESVDSWGDIVRQNWDFREFEQNPAMPLSHEWEGLPLGGHLDWEVVPRTDKARGYEGPSLRLLSLFATRETYPVADSTFRLVRANFLRMGSVGLVSEAALDVTDKEEREALGLGPRGVVFDQNVLIEFSPTLFGANAGAVSLLARAKSRGALEADDLQVAREIARRSHVDSSTWAADDQRYVAAVRLLFPKARFFERHPDREQPFELSSGLVLASGGGTPAPGAGDAAAALALIRERLEDTIATVEQGLLGLAARFESLEQQISEGRETDPGNGGAEDPDGAEEDGELMNRIAAFLSKSEGTATVD